MDRGKIFNRSSFKKKSIDNGGYTAIGNALVGLLILEIGVVTNLIQSLD